MRRKTFGSDPFCTVFVRVRTITLIKPLSILIKNSGQLKKALFVFANLHSHLRSSNVLTALESGRNRVGLLTGFQTKILNSSGYCPNVFYLWKSKTSPKHVEVLPKLLSPLFQLSGNVKSASRLCMLAICVQMELQSEVKKVFHPAECTLDYNKKFTIQRMELIHDIVLTWFLEV